MGWEIYKLFSIPKRLFCRNVHSTVEISTQKRLRTLKMRFYIGEMFQAFVSREGPAVQGQHFAIAPLQGVVAVACTDPQSFNQRVDALGGAPASHAVLIWNFRDPIHPELILESPYEVFCFQSNPLQPEVITGGCYNGQIIMWDTASQEVACLHCSCLHLCFHCTSWTLLPLLKHVPTPTLQR